MLRATSIGTCIASVELKKRVDERGYQNLSYSTFLKTDKAIIFPEGYLTEQFYFAIFYNTVHI